MRPSVSTLVRRLNNELADTPLLTHGGETWKMVTGLLFKSSEFGFIVLESETCDPIRSESRDEPVTQLFRKSPQQQQRQQQHVLLEVCDESSSRFPVGGEEHRASAVAPRLSSWAPLPLALSIPPGSRPSGGRTLRRAALPAAPPPVPRRLESAGTE